MIHPATRRRRQKRRMMAQPSNKEIQGKEITIKINLDKGTVSEETQKNQQRNQPENQGWTWWQQLIGVELLIGGFIISWYVITFCYQVGFKNYLHIPLYYMDFTLFTLLIPGLDLLIVLSSLIILIIWFFTRDRLIKYSFCIMFPFINFIKIKKFDIITIKEALLLFVSLVFLSIILTRRANRLGKYDKKAEEFNRSPVGILVFIILMLVFTLATSVIYGFFGARNQDGFYIINDHKKIKVVLDTYKDYYITAPVNIKKKTFKPEFELIPMYKDDKEPPVKVVKDSKELNHTEKQEEKIVLKYMEIGSLRPETSFNP